LYEFLISPMHATCSAHLTPNDPYSSEALCNISQQPGLLLWRVVSPTPSRQDVGPPIVGYTRLFIQYVCCYPSNLETVSSIRNLRTRYAAVTGTRITRTIGQVLFLKKLLCFDVNITVTQCIRYSRSGIW
jgi:hypothetical protein